MIFCLFLVNDSIQYKTKNNDVAHFKGSSVSKRYLGSNLLLTLNIGKKIDHKNIQIHAKIFGRKQLDEFITLKKTCEEAGINFGMYLRLRYKLIKRLKQKGGPFLKWISKID